MHGFFGGKVFSSLPVLYVVQNAVGVSMKAEESKVQDASGSALSKDLAAKKAEELKVAADSLTQLSKDRAAIADSLRGATRGAGGTKKLWKTNSKPFLIQAGLALLVFPEPIVSDALGTALLAAGAVQEGVKRQATYIDDLPKAFQSAMRHLKDAKDTV